MQKLVLKVALIFLGFTGLLMAQNGNVQGTIVDESGINVPGASVFIKSLNIGAVSDFDGRFTLVGIPAGDHTLTVQFMGYTDYNEQVSIFEGGTQSVSIALSPKTVELKGVEVTAYGLSAQARALNTQKNNTNITNVVSTDQIGKFPDANIGDAAKRVPGITMQVDQGEARNIIVRGLAPQLNSVTLNGSRIPSAEGDNRNIQMDLIPADMIQMIEVNKALTPDMEADALGASVNLVTRTSPQDFRVAASLGGGVNFINNKRILNGSVMIGDRSANGKFGIMGSISYNDSDFGSDNIEAEWADSFEYFDGTDEVEMDVDPYTDTFEQRTYWVQRIRRSVALNMDYQIDNNNTLYLKTMYNWRDDRENRFVLEHGILDAEDIEMGDFTITNNVPTRFPVEVKRETKGGNDSNRNKNRRLEDQRMQNYTLGGEHLLGNLQLDWMASYAMASEERNNERYAVFANEYTILNDNSDSHFPIFLPENAADANDLASFEFDEITEENQYTDEADANIRVDAVLPADLFGNGGSTLKFGVRGRFKTKKRDNDFYEFDLESQFPTMADVATADYTDPDFLAGSQYKAGYFATENWLGSLALENGDSVPDEFLRANFDVDEDVFAAYAMTTQKITDAFTALVGLRLERTSVTATGNQIIDEDNAIGTITEKSEYTNVLPSVHLKYAVGDNTVLRFAWTNALARPNYVDLVPTVDVVYGDEEIFVGNPDLDPTTSMNFDFMAEYYFNGLGMLSGGVFYKNLRDFIYTYQTEAEDDSYGQDTAGFDVYQPRNGDKASILGAEVALQRQLDFLPGFARNFNIMLNYTYLTSDTEGIRNEDGDERPDVDLPGTAPHMFNASLGYSGKKFNIRLSANYSASYIDEIGGEAFEDRYYDKQFLLDFNASYAITPSLRIYADWNNITDQPLRFYQGTASRTMQAEYYGSRIGFGVKYDFIK